MAQVTSRRLTIFEGPDGAGKSTAAKQYAAQTGARYVHFPALPRVTDGLARLYVEGMLPALLGYQDVVFDRSWLSEVPYGRAFRAGKDRLGATTRRVLERLAMRCGALVVWCQPPWEAVEASYLRRRQREMLTDLAQLRVVYDLYDVRQTDLTNLVYDYTAEPEFVNHAEPNQMALHPLGLASAGNWQAEVALVGESFAERKNHDPLYQWPFGSFSEDGCSWWLAKKLTAWREDRLFWVNADQDLSRLHDVKTVIALGEKAASELYRHKIQAVSVPHPQYWKRFHATEKYPLLDHLPRM